MFFFFYLLFFGECISIHVTTFAIIYNRQASSQSIALVKIYPSHLQNIKRCSILVFFPYRVYLQYMNEFVVPKMMQNLTQLAED